MILAAAWFWAEDCGAVGPSARSWRHSSAALSDSAQVTELVGAPVKYYQRMTAECRGCLLAAGLALKAAGWPRPEGGEIGLVAAGYDGCLKADQDYFRDYMDSGRTLGRGNLFIYTLPTSVLGELAIALSLAGPTLHVQDDRRPLRGLVEQAERFVAEGEAVGMLALWSDGQASVCLAAGLPDRGDGLPPETISEASPLALARKLSSIIREP